MDLEAGRAKFISFILLIGIFIVVILSFSYVERRSQDEQISMESDTELTESREKHREKSYGYTGIAVTISTGSMQQKISLYRDEDVLYAFMPAAWDQSSLRCSYDAEQYKLIYAGQEIADGETVPMSVQDGKETLQIIDLEQDSDTFCTLCLMQSENIPAVFINTQSGTMDWIHMEKGNYESGDLSYIDGDGTVVYAGALNRITGRGNSSWTEDKKSYSITLAEEAGLAGMPAAAKWILQANALDATRLRNKVTYDMARDMGLQYAIDSAYVDVWLNGEYAGNYLLCEKIEAGENRVDISIGDVPVKEAGTYTRDEEGGWWEYASVPDTREGYLLEFNERIEEEEEGFFVAGKRQVEVKSPDGLSREEYQYIKEYAQKMTECLESAEDSDAYLEYIDLESWSMLFLINEMTNDTDSNRHSVFYYKDKGTKMYAGPIWDYDIAWGNDFLGKDVRCSFFRNGWYGTLYDNDVFYQSIVTNYKDCMKPVLENALSEHIDELCGRIDSSVRMDDIRWAHSGGYTRRSDERVWEEAVNRLKDYMRKRMTYFDSVWLSGETYHRVFLLNGDMVVAVTYVRDGDMIPESLLDYAAGCLGQNSWGTDEGVLYDRSESVHADMSLHAVTVQADEEE